MIRCLTRAQDTRSIRHIGDQKQRMEMLNYVLRNLIPRVGESEQDFTARAEAEVDRMGMPWRVFADLEIRQRAPTHVSEYDVIRGMWA